MDLSAVRGKRVLLKPNVGRVALPGEGITTHPEVVAAAIDVFREAGAEVAVGESPIVGVDVQEAFDVSGIGPAAARRDCPVIDLDRRRFRTVSIPDGRAIQSLKVCADVLESDFVVSLPVMKTHMHTVATLAVKNMKGCLWRRSKVRLHMLPPVEGSDDKSIDVAIADMSSVLRADLAVIDGTVGMEGLGPAAGGAKSLDAVVVGADSFAADAVACRLMGIDAEHVPHLRIGARRGYGVIDPVGMTVSPENWQDWISPFSAPPENLAIEFPDVNVLDAKSCSACQSTLLLFLTQYREVLIKSSPSDGAVNVAIGRGHDELPDGTLCIGNCTLQQSDRGIYVPGCPPVGSQILATITGKPSTDDADADE